MRITSYWCQLFILPRLVTRKVNSICRSFLWRGDITNSSSGNLRWDKVCQPKKYGGLGIWNLDVWNLVAVGKLAWHISSMLESLCAKWVNEVYTKGADLMLINPPVTAS